MIQTLLIFLVIAAIAAQIPHAYYVFIRASKLKNKSSRQIQAGSFCLILSTAIFTFVIMGEVELALLGALIEFIINIWYYTEDFWDKGFGRTKYKWTAIARLWRQRWMYFFISTLMPGCIFIFSELLTQYL